MPTNFVIDLYTIWQQQFIRLKIEWRVQYASQYKHCVKSGYIFIIFLETGQHNVNIV